MNFKEAVEAAPSPVNEKYQSGIQALERRHRSKVKCDCPRRLTGSIDLDSALKKHPDHADRHRWDYGIGYQPSEGKEQAVWIEVHTATEKEISRVLRKLQWLRDWLEEEAEQLNRMTQYAKDLRFVWIASSEVRIPKNSRRIRELNQKGIPAVRKILNLP